VPLTPPPPHIRSLYSPSPNPRGLILFNFTCVSHRVWEVPCHFKTVVQRRRTFPSRISIASIQAGGGRKKRTINRNFLKVRSCFILSSWYARSLSGCHHYSVRTQRGKVLFPRLFLFLLYLLSLTRIERSSEYKGVEKKKKKVTECAREKYVEKH
jgi:hypothetical protein